MSKIRVSCTICKKDFLPKNLESHISTVHGGNKAYKCHLCTHSVSTKNFLKTHLFVFHKDNTPVDIELAAMFTGLEKPAESKNVKNVNGDKIKKTSKIYTRKAKVEVNTPKAKARMDKNTNLVNHGKRTRSNFKIDSEEILKDQQLKKRKKMDSDSSSNLKALPIKSPEVKPKSTLDKNVEKVISANIKLGQPLLHSAATSGHLEKSEISNINPEINRGEPSLHSAANTVESRFKKA